MKLTDLEPKLFRDSRVPDDDDLTLENAGALEFSCPLGCKDHRVTVPIKPWHSGGWDRTGETLENVTLKPSIQVVDGCRWHGFVTNGEITTC